MSYSLFSLTTLFIAAAYLLAGVIDSICGGGGLITIPALMAAGLPTEYVVGTNQCAALPGTFVSFLKFMKSGNIHYKSALFAVPFSAVGALAGAKLNLLIPVSWLQNILIVLVPILAAMTLLSKNEEKEALVDQLPAGQVFMRAAAIGLIVGGYQGFYGPGSGMIAIMAFSMILKLDLLRSVGNTKVAIGFSMVTASAAYALSGTVLWMISAAAAVFYIIGSYIGACMAIKNGQKVIRPVVVIVSVLLVVKVALFR